MRKIAMITLAGLASLALSGCGEEEVKTKEYYIQHDAERTEKLAWCEESADREATTNCSNAHSASEKIKMNQLFGEGISMDGKDE